MRLERILLAVDDSPAALAATRVAIALAAEWGSTVRALAVTSDGNVRRSLRGGRGPEVGKRLDQAAAAMLGWVAEVAEKQSVNCETVQRAGKPFRQILDESETWDADVIVMGRSDRTGPASPYLGSEVEHVLEFSDRPVLVVPVGGSRDTGHDGADRP